MTRRDWVLLLLGLKSARRSPKLDPVRIQKGMFLFAQEAAVQDKEKYAFEPLHYGPYSRELRRDVEDLVRQGLAEKRPVPGYTWSEYVLTPAGLGKATALLSTAPQTELRRLFDIKKEITGVPFGTLLRDVYEKYPDFAVNSIFQG